MSTIRNAKGNFDIYAIVKCEVEAFENDIKTIEDLRRVQKTLVNEDFYVRQGKLLKGYDLVTLTKAITTAKELLATMAPRFTAATKKSKFFYQYSVEEINALELDKLKAYGKCLASYLCNNGIDDRYEEFYTYYQTALDAYSTTRTKVDKAVVAKLLETKMTKQELIDALKELTK